MRFLLKNWRGSKNCDVIAPVEMAVEYLSNNILKYSEFLDEQQDQFVVKMRKPNSFATLLLQRLYTQKDSKELEIEFKVKVALVADQPVKNGGKKVY